MGTVLHRLSGIIITEKFAGVRLHVNFLQLRVAVPIVLRVAHCCSSSGRPAATDVAAAVSGLQYLSRDFDIDIAVKLT